MDPITGAAIIGVGGGILSGIMNNRSQENANTANIASAREQTAFQREMSETQYQRATKDLRLAGLNPMLAYSNGGASSPAGASAQSSSTDFSQSAGTIANSARAAVDQKRERSAMESAINLQAIQGQTAKAQGELNQASAKNAEANAKLAQAELPAVQSQTKLDIKRNKIDEKALMYDAVVNRVGQAVGIGASATGLGRFLKNSQMPREPGRLTNPRAMPRNKQNLGTTSSGEIFNKKTGEIYD